MKKHPLPLALENTKQNKKIRTNLQLEVVEEAYDLLNNFDWSEEEKKQNKKFIRKELMEKTIREGKIWTNEQIPQLQGFLCGPKGNARECKELMHEFLHEKLLLALEAEGKGRVIDHDDLEAWIFFHKEHKDKFPCLACGMEDSCLFVEHQEPIWEAVREYASSNGLLEEEKKEKVRAVNNKLRKAAYAAFHASYFGQGGGRIVLPDCVEFGIKYWLDAEDDYMGFRKH